MAKFYMDNLILTNMNHWDPNSRLGDMQLMALASWLSHEYIRSKEVKIIMEKRGEGILIHQS